MEALKSKLLLLEEQLNRTGELLRCPICAQGFVRDGGALRCKSGHSFDLSRRGYVNLLTGKPGGMYTRPLWEARARAVDAGWFNPLYDAIEIEAPDGAALDAGCGEGGLASRFAHGGKPCIGADISRDAVIMASGRGGFLPVVADIAHLPIADGSLACVLNVLSPANRAEFCRVLRPEGILIKAAPTANHLRQLRDALRGSTAHEGERSSLNGFRQISARQIEYNVIPGAAVADLVAMTPLSWHASEPEKLAFERDFSGDITFSFTLYVYARDVSAV